MNVKVTQLITTGAAVLLAGTAVAAEKAPVAQFEWDEAASAELEHELHRMHEDWNESRIEALKELMVGDDVLVTFELDPRTHQPIRLTTKGDIDRFVDDTVDAIEEDGGSVELEMPALNCRATDSFGVCTEECTVHIRKADGVEYTDELWSTNIAVKTDEGWRWIQWHMSLAKQGSGTLSTVSGTQQDAAGR
ncbi:MAG: nuclear transport factor 2 family protein [Proteobacteria bacterium]|nr:nuclear transport factor 2 family protein [Pseudomonadota bacterium]